MHIHLKLTSEDEIEHSLKTTMQGYIEMIC